MNFSTRLQTTPQRSNISPARSERSVLSPLNANASPRRDNLKRSATPATPLQMGRYSKRSTAPKPHWSIVELNEGVSKSKDLKIKDLEDTVAFLELEKRFGL